MSPTIIAIERRGPGVVAVTISGGGGGDERTHLLPLEALILHRIHEGAEFAPAEWERIRTDGALLLATRRSLELLAHRQRTERELRDTLGSDFEPADIDRALERLHELGYLDDAAWANRYVMNDRSRARGGSLIRQEMRAHGVPDDVAADALEGRDDLPAAVEAANRRVRSLRSLDEERRRRRLYDFLRRRGFADSVARRAMEAALASLAAADAPSRTL